MLDTISKFFLTFGHYEAIVPLSVLGYLCYDREKWGRVIYITIFGLMVSTSLKGIWQVPLAPWLKSTSWAFPSGHMFGACVFYLWISHEMKQRWISNTVIVILCGIGFGLIQQKYHDIYDVLGAIVFAVLLLFCYSKLLKIKLFQEKPDLIVLPLFPIAISLLVLMPVMHLHMIPTLCALGAFGLGWIVTRNRGVPQKFVLRVINLVIFCSVFFGVYKFLWSAQILQIYRLIYAAGSMLLLMNLVFLINGVRNHVRLPG
jgi:hypothetical protein